MRLRKPLFLCLVLVLALTALPALYAQDVPVLTLSMPEFMENLFTPELLAEFEQANGVKVNIVSSGFNFFGGGNSDLETYLDNLTEYVSSADVVFADSSSLTVEASRAGLFLDLAPLTQADATLNPDDFFPSMWQSVQWDGGVWAIPVSADVTMLVYDQAAFDEAGLSYPNERWTIDDLANAARTLADYDSSGEVSSPGLLLLGANQVGLLAYSLLGQGFYDTSVLPNAPSFDNPALESILTTAAELLEEGVVSSAFSGDFNEVPMRIIGSFGFGSFSPNDPDPGVSLLPGGRAGLDVQGFAVSSGTRYPEAAYALAKFLSLRPEITNNFFGASPARQSLVGVEAPPPSDDTGGAIVVLRGALGNEEAVQLGLANAIPSSELRFSEYVSIALQKMTEDGLDARSALQEAEVTAVTNLQTAADRKANTVVAVATPVPTPVLAAGEVSLKFGYLSFIQPMANADDWERVIAEFVAADPQVRQVTLDTDLRQPDAYAEATDCWYLPLNYVPQADLTTILNLDPYMDVDSSFDKSDVAGGVLSQLQRDNKTWAMPIVIQPQALNYNSQLFAQAGVPEPGGGWSTEEFKNALSSLKFNMADDEYPFSSRSPGGTYLLLLIASYGGIPLDYRTTPPTINFTDPASVDAIRQVLDLVKEGYIEYQELAGSGGLAIFIGAGAADDLPAIYTTSLGGFFGRGGPLGQQSPEDSNYKLANYPRGSQFSAATYDLGTAYISATTANADACYRWISTLARHPELFGGMPARRSLLTDPTVTASQTPDEVAFYQNFDALLSDPNTVAFPSNFAGGSAANFLVERWLNAAFDHYVLNDADLEAELADAQTYASAFLECTATIPPFDPSQGNQLGFFQQYIDCATKVDPNMEGLFPQLSN